MGKRYFIYLMTNRSGTLYAGVTSNLTRKVYEHKHKLVAGFTANYKITQLVHFEEFSRARDAIAREKQIKGWRRAKKIALIEANNPNWEDLSSQWYDHGDSLKRGTAHI